MRCALSGRAVPCSASGNLIGSSCNCIRSLLKDNRWHGVLSSKLRLLSVREAKLLNPSYSYDKSCKIFSPLAVWILVIVCFSVWYSMLPAMIPPKRNRSICPKGLFFSVLYRLLPLWSVISLKCPMLLYVYNTLKPEGYCRLSFRDALSKV